MKIPKKVGEGKVPIVRVDKSLNKFDGVVLFPAKLEKANKLLQSVGPPKQWTVKKG